MKAKKAVTNKTIRFAKKNEGISPSKLTSPPTLTITEGVIKVDKLPVMYYLSVVKKSKFSVFLIDFKSHLSTEEVPPYLLNKQFTFCTL